MPLDTFGLLTVKEVAQLLHCSKAHISNVIAGKVHGFIPIPAVRLGRRTLVRHESLRAWIDAANRFRQMIIWLHRQYDVPENAHKEKVKCAKAGTRKDR